MSMKSFHITPDSADISLDIIKMGPQSIDVLLDLHQESLGDGSFVCLQLSPKGMNP